MGGGLSSLGIKEWGDACCKSGRPPTPSPPPVQRGPVALVSSGHVLHEAPGLAAVPSPESEPPLEGRYVAYSMSYTVDGTCMWCPAEQLSSSLFLPDFPPLPLSRWPRPVCCTSDSGSDPFGCRALSFGCIWAIAPLSCSASNGPPPKSDLWACLAQSGAGLKHTIARTFICVPASPHQCIGESYQAPRPLFGVFKFLGGGAVACLVSGPLGILPG